MPRFMKKPIIVEAHQWFKDMDVWPNGVHEDKAGNVFVETIHGPVPIVDGTWIIIDIKGKSYPCEVKIFEETYEMIDVEPKIPTRAGGGGLHCDTYMTDSWEDELGE